jgi:hypothetical protein
VDKHTLAQLNCTNYSLAAVDMKIFCASHKVVHHVGFETPTEKECFLHRYTERFKPKSALGYFGFQDKRESSQYPGFENS